MPHLSDIRRGWDHWYHLVLTAYGQWLRGDPRGWRERHHRQHVAGDYKFPPPPSAYNAAILAQSSRLLKHEPQFFLPADRPFLGSLMLETLGFQEASCRAACVGGEHIHALARCMDDDLERLIGRAKQFLWSQFHAGMPRPWPKLWAKRPYGKPIRDRSHFEEASGYILEHAKKGAWVWEAPIAGDGESSQA